MKRIHLILAVITCCIFISEGRRVNSLRGKLQLKPSEVTKAVEADTVYENFTEIKIAGFEKAQNSSTESFFIINNSDNYIIGINLSVEYINRKGEQLHLNTVTLDCDIPSGQTRSVQMKSWDRQHLWYYVNTQGRHNEYCNPFDVRIRINHIIIRPER